MTKFRKLTKTQKRMSRVKQIIFELQLMRHMRMADGLKLTAIINRHTSAYKHLASRHHKRANVQLTMALALLKGI